MYPQTYKLTPAAYQAARKRMIIAVPVLMVVFALPFAYAWYTNPVRMSVNWSKAAAVAGAIVIFVIIRLVKLVQRQKTTYEEFELTIDHDRITGRTLLSQDIDLSYIEITQIVKHIDGSFIITAGPKNLVINIPADVERPEQLEALLGRIGTIAINPVNWFSKYFKLIGLGVFAVIIIYIYSRNKIIVGVAAPVLIAVFLWIFLNMRMSGDEEKRPKPAKQIIGFGIIILAIIIKAVLVFTGRL